jgi:hypothetical protein
MVRSLLDSNTKSECGDDKVNTFLTWGTRVVVLALISYSLSFLRLNKNRRVEIKALVFQSLGLLLDISSTSLMILGSRNTPFTLHGIFGYSALFIMIVDTIMVWRFYRRYGEKSISKNLHRFARVAYFWWVIAFLLGLLLVIVV